MNIISRLLYGCLLSFLTGTAFSELAETETPAGFEFFSELQTSAIDVYYNNQYLGSFIAEYNFEKIRFNRPELMTDTISGIKLPEVVTHALEGWLNPNTRRHCQAIQTSNCGFISPEIAGVIFYEDQFRADLFINPLQLHEALQTTQYLPLSSAKPAFLQSLTTNFSGDNNSDTEDSYNFAGKSLLGWGQNHIESNWNLANDQSLTIATLSLNHDAEGKHYSAGFLQSKFGFSPFLYSRPIIGISLGTSEDTLLNKDALVSDPVDINLPTQALVEVYKDNLLIHSELMEGGQQKLNTNGFPYGTYDIVIKAKTPNGITLFEERRLFVKQTRIHTGDYRGWFFESGQMTTPSTSGLPNPEHTWITRAGYERGLRQDLGARFSLTASGKDFISESELGFTRPGIWLAAGLLLGADQQGSSLSSELTVNDVSLQGNSRRIWKNRKECEDRTDSQCLLSSLKVYDTLSVSSSFLSGRLYASYSFREQEDLSDHIKSLSYYRQLLHEGIESIGCNFEISEQENSLTFRISLDITFDLLEWRHQLNSQYQEDHLDNNQVDRNYRVAARSSWVDQHPDRRNTLEGSIGIDKTKYTETLSGNINARTSSLLANLTATFSQSDLNNTVTRTGSYSGSISTAMTVDKSGIAIGGTDLYDSAVNVSVLGAQASDTFQILIDGNVRGFVSGRGTTVVPLPPFRSYQVSIENAGDGFCKKLGRKRPSFLHQF